MASGLKKGTSFTGPVTQSDNRQSAPRAWQGKLPAGWEPAVALVFNDFQKTSDWTATDWSEVDVGAGTKAQVQEPFGLLRITTGATNGNQESAFLSDEYWTTTVGQRLWHKTRLKLGSSATTRTLLFGLSNGNPNDRISFDLSNGSAALKCTCTSSGTSTQVTLTGTYDLTQWTELSFVTDGTRVDFYVNDQRVASITTNIPLPAVTMRTSYLFVTNAGDAKVLDIDYFMTAQQRKAGDQP